MLDIRQRTGYLFLSVMLGHLILISAQVQSKTGVPLLESVTFGLFSRLQGGAASVVGGVRGGYDNYVDLRGVREENDALKKQLAELGVAMQQQRALAVEAERLRDLLALQKSATLPTMAAEVIAGNPIPGMQTVTIDRGTADGVQANMAVISPMGIIGRIVGPVASHAARVQLLIDRDAAIGALAERSRSGGMVVGDDADRSLRMELVSNLADVKAGDAVVASGVDGIFPKGFAIGTVESSENGPRLHRIITVRPAVDFSAVEQVLVVMTPARGATPAEAPPDKAKK